MRQYQGRQAGQEGSSKCRKGEEQQAGASLDIEHCGVWWVKTMQWPGTGNILNDHLTAHHAVHTVHTYYCI